MKLLPGSLIILSLIIFLIIVITPLLHIFGTSFIQAEDLFEILSLDERQLILLKNSLTIGLGVAIVSLLLGLPSAFLISRTDLPLRQFFLLAMILPIFMPPFITAVSWIKLLGPEGLNLPFNIYGPGGAIFILSFSYFPFVMLLTLSGLNAMDSKLEEAAALRYPKRKVFRAVTFPLVSPYIFSGAIFTFIFSISNYGVPDLLRVPTYPVEIFVQFSAFYNTPGAVLLAFPLVLALLLLILFQRHWMNKKSYVTISAQKGVPYIAGLAQYKALAVLFCLSIIFLAVVIPLVVLLMNAGSFLTYKVAFQTAYKQIFNSLFLALISATFICVLCFPISYLILRSKKSVSLITDILSVIPFAIPPAIFGIALIQLWNRPATGFIYKTLLVIIFGYTARFSAFAVRALSSNIGQINPNLEESAHLAVRSWPKKLFRVLMPLSKQGLLYGWVICFALSIGELETTLLVTPAGEATLPIRIYTLMHYGMNKLVFGLCVIQILLIFIPISLLMIYQRVHVKTRKARAASF